MTGGRLTLGIDPGLSGAFAFLGEDGVVEVFDIPTFKVGSKQVINEFALSRLVDERATLIRCAWLEQVSAMPSQTGARRMGATSAFTFGMGVGIIRGVLAANFVPVEGVPPTQWKRVMKVSGSKDEARMRATQLMPGAAHQWPLKKHDGRAEAALIALYGSRQDQVESAA